MGTGRAGLLSREDREASGKIERITYTVAPGTMEGKRKQDIFIPVPMIAAALEEGRLKKGEEVGKAEFEINHERKTIDLKNAQPKNFFLMLHEPRNPAYKNTGPELELTLKAAVTKRLSDSFKGYVFSPRNREIGKYHSQTTRPLAKETNSRNFSPFKRNKR